MSSRRAKGEGTIYKRQDGRFEGSFSTGSGENRRRKTFYGNTRKEVADKLRAYAARYQPGVDGLRLEEYLEEWLKDHQSDWEPQTYNTYASWIHGHIVPHLGQRKVEELTPADIRAWLRKLQDKGVGANTRKRSLTTLRSALQQLVDEELLGRNPTAPVKGPKIKKKPIQIPSEEEMIRLLKAADSHWLFTFVLLAITGTPRQGELRALHWKQVNFSEGSVLIDASLSVDREGKILRKKPKTEAGVRTVYLPDITIYALKIHKRIQEDAGYNGPWVFPGAEGGPLDKSNFVNRQWLPLLKRAGLERLRFHATRHAGNSLLIVQGGVDALSLSRRMGQTDTRMTFDQYGHLFAGAGRKVAERMNDALNQIGIVKDAFNID